MPSIFRGRTPSCSLLFFALALLPVFLVTSTIFCASEVIRRFAAVRVGDSRVLHRADFFLLRLVRLYECRSASADEIRVGLAAFLQATAVTRINIRQTKRTERIVRV